jgi:hypothetical protein
VWEFGTYGIRYLPYPSIHDPTIHRYLVYAGGDLRGPLHSLIGLFFLSNASRVSKNRGAGIFVERAFKV